MSTPKFATTHNLIALLEKPSESDGFEYIVDFLNANQIKCALRALKEVGDLPTDVQDTPIPNEPLSSQPQRKHKPRRKQRMETEVSPTKTNTEEHVPTHSNDPLPSEMKSSHKAKIEELESRVEKLEEENKSLTKELKSFNTRVESLTINETVVDKEESSKQGRKIADINANAEAKDKGKGLMVEPEMLLTRKDQIALNEEVAKGLEAEWNAEKDNINWNEVVE
nr:hypothetical protein [Tanacetum cinerariifolium]